MKSVFKVLGIIGLVCMAFGLGVGLYTSNFKDPYVILNLGLGAVFGVASLIVNAGDLRTGLTGRSTRMGANAIVYAAAVLAILVLVNFISARNHKRFDLTENKQYSLSEASVSLLKGLEKPIKITGFFVGGKAGPIEDLLGSYRYVNPAKFDWEIVDPDKRPELAERYGIRANASLVVESGEERKTLTEVNPATLEESLTNAVLAITGTGKKILCNIEGHGEHDVNDQAAETGYAAAKKAIEGENFVVRPLLLASVEAVPADCTEVLIAGPERPYFDHEVQALDTYLGKGGSLFVMLDPQYGGPLLGLLEKWGVTAQNDIVVDKVMRMFEGESLGLQPLGAAYAPDHPITRGFTKQTIFTQARSLAGGKLPEGYAVTELVKTSPNAWGETKIADLFKTGKVNLDPDDYKSPLALGVAVGPSGPEREGKGKLVVFGDSDFADNRYITAFFNGDLFLNAVNWLANQEKQISIRPKGPRASFVRLTDAQMMPIFYLAVLIFPQLLLTLGIIIAWRRR
jgi:ABC-type uncharacterized transport system involved in gliding motility auxiliary subunit